MEEKELDNYISSNPGIFGGKPIIKGRRIAVEHILSMIEEGAPSSEILEGYPFLVERDIEAAELWGKLKGKGKQA